MVPQFVWKQKTVYKYKTKGAFKGFEENK